ncbi:Tc toxin subunit A [Flindersiella endophytica]
MLVVAYRVTLRDEDDIGHAETDDAGRYRIAYRADVDQETQARGEVRLAVRLRVFDASKVVRFASSNSRRAMPPPNLCSKAASARRSRSTAWVRPASARPTARAEIGQVEADRIYAVAEQTYAMALSLATRLGATIREVNPAAIGQLLPAAQQVLAPELDAAPELDLEPFPNLQTLFGSLNLCACEHCRSVLSPAAYLTDMLRFMSQRMTAGKSAKSVLLARRPDIAQIELSCDNTNTVLPYIDIVNELLEDTIAPPADLAAAARLRQTTLPTPELNANPQYVNANAYATLAGAVHPWVLPFDLPLLEARAYFGQLGTDRIQLRRALRKEPDLTANETVQLAVEALRLSRLEADIITAGPLATAHQPWEYWGLAETGNTVRDPAETTKTYSGTWLEVLSHARILLARAQLTHAELQLLLATRFVNPDGTVATSDTCDLGAMTVANLGTDVLARLHRFVRLMRALDWSPDDLDTAIARLQAGTPAGVGRLNPLLLRQLRAATTAVRRFGIGVPEAPFDCRMGTCEVSAASVAAVTGMENDSRPQFVPAARNSGITDRGIGPG